MFKMQQRCRHHSLDLEEDRELEGFFSFYGTHQRGGRGVCGGHCVQLRRISGGRVSELDICATWERYHYLLPLSVINWTCNFPTQKCKGRKGRFDLLVSFVQIVLIQISEKKRTYPSNVTVSLYVLCSQKPKILLYLCSLLLLVSVVMELHIVSGLWSSTRKDLIFEYLGVCNVFCNRYSS